MRSRAPWVLLASTLIDVPTYIKFSQIVWYCVSSSGMSGARLGYSDNDTAEDYSASKVTDGSSQIHTSPV